MRSKHPSRTRTRTHSREQHQQPRAWGTRFDYLDTSPPPAQSSAPTPSPATSPTPADSSEQLTHALSLELFGANSKATEKRDWADDDVPSTLFSPGRTPLILNLASGTTHGRKDIAKQPHNASVFVGSLPPDTDEAETAQLLAQHLSRFANVQNIKIVHDSKGGLCAFVQCENATQATQLVSQAQANPQRFMGRYLRYENARARRTLWISYRTPMHFMQCASKDEEGPDIVIDENGIKGRWIESDLPDALRIWKPRDVRFPIVTLRGEARNIGDLSRFDKDASASDTAPAFRQKGVLFTDLKFDLQMVKKMAEAFGPLEAFKTLIGNDTGEEADVYPADHDAARTRDMDPCVWEIKWEHRDDCITALNTLRRIPFLTVTWAKDCGLPQTPRVGSLHLRTPTSPHYPTAHASREAISPVARGRPFLLLDCKPRDGDEFGNADLPMAASSFVRSANALSPKKAVELRRKGESAHCIPEDDTDEGWTVVRSQNVTRTIATSLSGNTSRSPTMGESKGRVPDWSEGDFPPLKTECPRPDEPRLTEGKSESPLPSVFIPLNDPAPLNPEDEETSAHDASSQGDSTAASRPSFSHRRSLSNPVASSQVQLPQESQNVQKLEIPPTPELADSSLTQTPTSAQPELVSPNYPTLVPLAGSDHPVHEQKVSEQRHTQDVESTPSESGQSATGSIGTSRYDHRRQMTVDPKTCFVGGLESFGPRPWDESRLREIFGKYGEIREIRVVSPSSKKAGFAFVTFVDEQSTEKAIREEHNRFYDGRQIRVQIRDMFPQRSSFKFRGRGLNRRSFGFDTHRDGIRYRCSTESIDRNASLMSNGVRPFDHHFAYTRGVHGNTVNAPFQVNPRAAQQLVPSTSIGTDSSTLRSLNSFDSKTEVDFSHESESKTAASVSPPPSTLNASVSTTSLSMPVTPQAMPSMQSGYYQPYAWMMPYSAQVHYPMAYGTVGGVMPPGPAPFTSASQGADPNVVPAGVPAPWNPMYKTTVPFAPYSYVVMTPTGTEVPHPASVTAQPATPVKGQPPLHAAGFIQGEHGILFPVYQPEALNDYMNSSSPTRSTTTNRAPMMNSASSSSGQQQPNLVPAQVWQGFAHAPQFFPYPVASPSAVGANSLATPPVAIPQHSNHQQMHGRPSPVPTTARGSCATPFITDLTHSLPMQDQSTAFTPLGVNAPGMPPPYFVGAPSSTAATAARLPHVGSQGSHSMHAFTPERLNVYNNKYPSRRDLAFHQSRNAQYGRAQGPVISSARPPSGARSTGGPVNSAHVDHQNNHVAQQRQRQASAAPPLELGFNKYTQDNGHSHQHKWIGNFEQ